MSENTESITAKVPLTAQQQWETFIADHGGRWQGVLVRYDAAGQVLDILDSVRTCIPSDDRQTVTHSIDFRSRMTETVTQKQWVLTSGNPLIIIRSILRLIYFLIHILLTQWLGRIEGVQDSILSLTSWHQEKERV